jgi:hypothetical protein
MNSRLPSETGKHKHGKKEKDEILSTSSVKYLSCVAECPEIPQMAWLSRNCV